MSITHDAVAGPLIELTDYQAAHLVADASITAAQLAATGTPGPTTFLRGDGTWNTGPVGSTGATGATGPAGQSFTWQGVWSTLTTYALDDVVEGSDGSTYISKGAGNIAHDPTLDTLHVYWDTFAVHGAVGPTGPTGPQPPLGTTPSTQAFGDSPSGGSATDATKTDHKHGMPANPVAYAVPSLTLGTSNSAGAAASAVRTDATILAFDATAPAAVGTAAVGNATVAARRNHVHATGAGTPVTQAFGDAASVGAGPAAAMTNHKHGMPTSPLGLPLALTGATAATRYVGGTASGPPTSGTFAVGDFVITQDGNVIVCITAGTPGTWQAAGYDHTSLGALGAQTIPAVTSLTDYTGPTSGVIYLAYFQAKRGVTTANIKVMTGGTGSTTPTLVRMGLYTAAANGDLTLVANTPSDTNLFSNAWYAYTEALAASYLLIPGQRYAGGILQVAATPGHFLYGNNAPQLSLNMRPRQCSSKTGLADLPSSITDASMTETNLTPYMQFTT